MTDPYDFSHYDTESIDPVQKVEELTSEAENKLERHQQRQKNHWDEVHPRESSSHYETPVESAFNNFYSVAFDTDGDSARGWAELILPVDNIPDEDELPDPLGEASSRLLRNHDEIFDIEKVRDDEQEIDVEMEKKVVLDWLKEFFVYSEEHQDWPHPAGVMLESAIDSAIPVGKVLEPLHEMIIEGHATNHTFRIISKIIAEWTHEFVDLSHALRIELVGRYVDEQFDIGLLSLVYIFTLLAEEYAVEVVDDEPDVINNLCRISGDSAVQVETRVRALQALVNFAGEHEAAREIIRNEIENITSALESDNTKISQVACDVVTRCRTNDEQLEQPIKELLQSPDMDTVLAARRAYATLIGKEDEANSVVDFDPKQPSEKLMNKLGGGRVLQRLHAAQALTESDKKAEPTEIVDYFEDEPDADVRACLCGILLESDIGNEDSGLYEEVATDVYIHLDSAYPRQESKLKHIELLHEILFKNEEIVVSVTENIVSSISDSDIVNHMYERLRSAVIDDDMKYFAESFARLSLIYVGLLEPVEDQAIVKNIYTKYGKIISDSDPKAKHLDQVYLSIFAMAQLEGTPLIESDQIVDGVIKSAEIEVSNTPTTKAQFQLTTRSWAVQVLSIYAVNTSDESVLPIIYRSLAHTRYVYQRWIESGQVSGPSVYNANRALQNTVIAIRILAFGDNNSQFSKFDENHYDISKFGENAYHIPEGTRQTLIESVDIDDQDVVREVIKTLSHIEGEEVDKCLKSVAENPNRNPEIISLASSAVSNRS